MTTTITTIDGKKVALTIEQKARLLTIFEISEPFVAAVTSGSNATDAYVVRHDGRKSHYCPCAARGVCAHRVAVDWKLESARRDEHCGTFAIYDVA
jgi:hypothetical protein